MKKMWDYCLNSLSFYKYAQRRWPLKNSVEKYFFDPIASCAYNIVPFFVPQLDPNNGYVWAIWKFVKMARGFHKFELCMFCVCSSQLMAFWIPIYK